MATGDQGRRAKPAGGAVKDTAALLERDFERRAQEIMDRCLKQLEERLAQAHAAQAEHVLRSSEALQRLVADAVSRLGALNATPQPPPPPPPPQPVRYSVTADQMLEIFRRITDSVGRGQVLNMTLFMQHLDEVLYR